MKRLKAVAALLTRLDGLLDVIEEPYSGSGSHGILATKILDNLNELREISDNETSVKLTSLKSMEKSL